MLSDLLFGTGQMDLAHWIERGFGIAYVTCGLALMISPGVWEGWVKELSRSKNMLFMGVMTTFVGAFMVAGHNIWESSPRVVTTIIAWIALAKGLLLMSFPEAMKRFSLAWIGDQVFLRIGGFFAMILGGLIVYYSALG